MDRHIHCKNHGEMTDINVIIETILAVLIWTSSNVTNGHMNIIMVRTIIKIIISIANV